MLYIPHTTNKTSKRKTAQKLLPRPILFIFAAVNMIYNPHHYHNRSPIKNISA